MIYSDIVKKVAEELNLPITVVDKAYKGYWLFVRTKIQSLPLKEISPDEFDTLRTNFNIPSLGKLYCTKEKWLGVKRRHNYIKKLQNGT